MTVADIASVASASIAAIAACVAIGAIYVPWNLQRNKELLEQAILSLERAYEALSNSGRNVAPPLADRLNWLTAARHIQRYRALKSKIKTSVHQTLCEEHEEYWRHQFYLCLNARGIHSASYFDAGPSSQQNGPIEPRSAVVIFSFASWPETRRDPIDDVNVQQLIREFNPLQASSGLREYMSRFPRLTDGT